MTFKKENNFNQTPLLEVKDFSLSFRQYGYGLREKELAVIHRLDVTIYPGEIVAVVGASGSGKSLLADAILGILPDNAITSGTLNYKGTPLTKKRQQTLRGKELSLIPQSVNALDPLMKTGQQVQTMIKGKKKTRIATQQSVFKNVGLSKQTSQLYPFELSGGMSRRVLVSTAMVSQANLIIADEPTPGLDPQAMQDTLKHMKDLVIEDKGMMFITHDIALALQLADKIAVFNAGETVDHPHVTDFSGYGERLSHPYTKALWKALPQNEFQPVMDKQIDVNGDKKNDTDAVKKGITQTNALEVNGISYHYPDSPWLFKQVDLLIRPGEIVGLFGYSGSGKSTMAEIMAGYKAPLEGRIVIGDQPVTTGNGHPVQLVLQHPEQAINPRWRMRQVEEEVGGFSPALKQALGINEEWLSRWPSELSGGELQRFNLARALSSQHIKYLIADEMSTMLDAITQANIWKTVQTLAKERQIGVLAISHDYALLERVSDRIINFSELIGDTI